MAAETVLLPADLAVSPKYAAFDLVETSYKQVNSTPIPVSILIPKNARPGRHPVMVRWHGGGLVTGHRLFPEWFSQWLVDLAAKTNAIVLCPDYRLIPEVSAVEILEDLRDFYKWLLAPQNLQEHLPSGIESDLENVLVTGESAGGWATLQTGFLEESKENFAAIIPLYPMIDMRDRWYTEDYEKIIFDPPAPQIDRSVLSNYLANMKKGDVVTSAIPPSRSPLVISMFQQGKYGKVFGDDAPLYPIEMLEKVDALPPTWMIHGKDDNVIPIDGTYKYVAALEKKFPNARLHSSYRPGNHGFDQNPSATLEDDWVKGGVEFISQFWPKC